MPNPDLGQSVSPPAWMRDLYPAWSKRAAVAHRERKTCCPKCGGNSIQRFMHHPGHYACFACRHRWSDAQDVVSAFIHNPEAS